MLPPYFKFRVFNDAGVSVTAQLDWRPYRVGPAGSAFGPASTPVASGAVASAASVTSAAVDNTSGGYQGGHLTVTATPGATAAGNRQLLIYLLGSVDNSTFEDAYSASGEGYGSAVLGMTLTGTGGQRQVFEVPA